MVSYSKIIYSSKGFYKLPIRKSSDRRALDRSFDRTLVVQYIIESHAYWIKLPILLRIVIIIVLRIVLLIVL